LLGVVAMTTSQKVEQAVTHRPSSYIPARTLMTLVGRSPREDEQPLGWNLAMHYGTGALVGALRGVWAVTGLRGLRADLVHTLVRVCFDQTLENGSGAGAPPHTWPSREQVIDVLNKTVYSLVTGRLADRALAPTLMSQRGRTSH